VSVLVDIGSRLRELDGSGIFFSCCRRPTSINSAFEGFRLRRFEVIQEEICLTTCRRWSMDSVKLFGEKKMINWVSASYKWWSTEDALTEEWGCFDEWTEWSSVEDEQEEPKNWTLRNTTGEWIWFGWCFRCLRGERAIRKIGLNPGESSVRKTKPGRQSFE